MGMIQCMLAAVFTVHLRGDLISLRDTSHGETKLGMFDISSLLTMVKGPMPTLWPPLQIPHVQVVSLKSLPSNLIDLHTLMHSHSTLHTP